MRINKHETPKTDSGSRISFAPRWKKATDLQRSTSRGREKHAKRCIYNTALGMHYTRHTSAGRALTTSFYGGKAGVIAQSIRKRARFMRGE